MKNDNRGFTIVEILIVIVIISILAAIAVPSYRQYVVRTNRTVAKVALQDLVTRQESYAADHKDYATKFSMLGVTGADSKKAYVTADNVVSKDAAGAIYVLNLREGSGGSNCSGDSSSDTVIKRRFRLDATPVSPHSDTTCETICLSSTGEHGSSSGTAADCWRR